MIEYRPEYLNDNESYEYSREQLEQALEEGTILQAKATGTDSKLNLYVSLGDRAYGFIPYEEFEITNTTSSAVSARIGKAVCFKVTSIVVDNNGIIHAKLSRKQAQQECKKEFIGKLVSGQIVDAVVVNVESYGVFCDIGCGITSLLHIKNICISRINNLKEQFSHIRNLKVVILGIDNDGRVSITHKELLGTWEEETSKIKDKSTIGVVRAITKHGVFIELTPNLSGLAELHKDMDIKLGDHVSVYVKDIVPSVMKVKLSIKGICNYGKIDYIQEFKYTQTEGILEQWSYSTIDSKKKIQTIF